MEFKKLEVNQESNWFKRILKSKQTQKTFIFIMLGAIGGFIYYYVSIGKDTNVFNSKEIISSVITGAFLGFFIVNSPCARNKC